jgi:hypothetical protein
MTVRLLNFHLVSTNFVIFILQISQFDYEIDYRNKTENTSYHGTDFENITKSLSIFCQNNKLFLNLALATKTVTTIPQLIVIGNLEVLNTVKLYKTFPKNNCAKPFQK